VSWLRWLCSRVARRSGGAPSEARLAFGLGEAGEHSAAAPPDGQGSAAHRERGVAAASGSAESESPVLCTSSRTRTGDGARSGQVCAHRGYERALLPRQARGTPAGVVPWKGRFQCRNSCLAKEAQLAGLGIQPVAHEPGLLRAPGCERLKMATVRRRPAREPVAPLRPPVALMPAMSRTSPARTVPA
jgi:hypothetical protein